LRHGGAAGRTTWMRCGRLSSRDERAQTALRYTPRSLVSARAVHHGVSRWRRPAAGWGGRIAAPRSGRANGREKPVVRQLWKENERGSKLFRRKITRALTPRQQLTDASTAEAKPDGTWHLKFYHPAITQELRLAVVAKEGELSGTLTNETTGNTTPLSEGKVQGHQMSFTTVTASYSATVVWDGTIEGDFLAGTVNVKGMGSFPLEGTRVE
jgi:hypothetical protein